MSVRRTRTSSPVRITRGKDFQSLNTPGLYPAGEGAGYAGGILSAATDGVSVVTGGDDGKVFSTDAKGESRLIATDAKVDRLIPLYALLSKMAGLYDRAPDARVVYVMTDGAALPIAFSSTVAGLREAAWLHGTVTTTSPGNYRFDADGNSRVAPEPISLPFPGNVTNERIHQ